MKFSEIYYANFIRMINNDVVGKTDKKNGSRGGTQEN